MSHFFYNAHKKAKHKGHLIDLFIYPMALIAPIMTLPQLSEIWVHKNVAGVSVITWGAYALGGALWMIYGLVHKEKPIIVTNFVLLILQSSIVLGVLLYR